MMIVVGVTNDAVGINLIGQENVTKRVWCYVHVCLFTLKKNIYDGSYSCKSELILYIGSSVINLR